MAKVLYLLKTDYLVELKTLSISLSYFCVLQTRSYVK